MTMPILSRSTLKVRGCSGISFRASRMFFALRAQRQSVSHSLMAKLLSSVVSLSEAVIFRLFPCSSSSKQSNIGNEFFDLITRDTACRWLKSAELDTLNLIFEYFYISFI